MFQSILRVQHSVRWSASACLRKMTTGVDKALLSKLRKKTGFTFINCRKALEQYDNDIDKAESWLREQAQKEGWNKATKLQHRPMSQGLVGLVGDSNTATMVEVNCETDFVARNTKFVSLVSDLTLALGEHLLSQTDTKVALDSAALGVKVISEGGQSLADRVAVEVGSVGENMALRRAVHLRAGENNFLSSYIHLSGPALTTNSECQVGKFGAVLELRQLPESESDSSSSSSSDSSSDDESPISLEEACRQVAQHVVGMNPKQVGDLDPPPEDSGSVVQEQSEGGDDSSEEVEKAKEEDDTLMSQEFLLEPGTSVRDWLKQHNITVVDFVRFECGEDLGDD